MSGTSRETIIIALFNLIATAQAWALQSRRLQLIQSTGSSALPAMFVVVHSEEHSKEKTYAPAVRTLMADIWLYIDVGLDPNTVPDTTINNLIDSIDPVTAGVLMPNPLTGKQTLGGIVDDCWIEGKIERVQGDIDGLGLVIIPVKIVIP